MTAVHEVPSVDAPDRSQLLLREGEEINDGNFMVDILKGLDKEEVQSVTKLIELYEPRIKKAEDMVAQLVAVQNRHDETVQACRDKLAKHTERQVELDTRWDELNQRIVKTQSDINGRSAAHKADQVTRMLQTRQMAYSAVVRAIVNEFERCCGAPSYANDVPIEFVKARLVQIMSEESDYLAEIGQARPIFAKYITPESVDQLLAKTDDRHICLECDPYVTPGGTFYNLAELDQYVGNARLTNEDLSHGFGETERMVIHMYLAVLGKVRTSDMLSREARAAASWRDLHFASASLINELSEFHDISSNHAEWSMFREMLDYLENNPDLRDPESDSESDSDVVSSVDSSEESGTESD